MFKNVNLKLKNRFVYEISKDENCFSAFKKYFCIVQRRIFLEYYDEEYLYYLLLGIAIFFLFC